MEMEVKQAIRSQYGAALEMLRQVIVNCPAPLWDDPQDKNRFWHVAYHVLFYTHLYLQESEKHIVPWSKHRQEWAYLGEPAEPAAGDDQAAQPYSREDILEYLALCRQQVDEKVPALDPRAESGFYWLPFSKLELQLYNIRHIQQHTGELMERLGNRAGIDVDWVGQVP
jgi:hypothetical protein